MADVPKYNISGIQGAEGLIGNLFNYINSLNAGGAAPQVNPQGPTMLGLRQMLHSMNNSPMMLSPGGGVDPSAQSTSMRTSNLLGANPARSAIRQQQIATNADVQGQNLQLLGNNLFNTMGMQGMIDELLGSAAGDLGQIGTYPPYLRGMSQSTAASGTGGSGGMFGGFGF